MISFDASTARQMLSDAEIHYIEMSARAAVAHGAPMSPFEVPRELNVMSRVLAALRHVVWCEAYDEAQRKKAAG